jgi:hypothetical protein
MARRSKRSVAIPADARKNAVCAEQAPVPKLATLDGLDIGAGALVAAVAAILYGMSAARDIVIGDTPELVTAAIKLGVAHPPGYPLFTMLGHLFSLLPAGPMPFRLNLLAVVCGAGTVTLVYFTAIRLTGNRAASACAALVLASTPLFWSWSLVAEVFSVNNLFAAAMIYMLVMWQDDPDRPAFLIGAALLSGLALANQQTIVLLGPAVLFVLWRRRKELLARPRIVVASGAALMLGLLAYAYLPWAAARHPLWNWGDPVSMEKFLAVVTRKHFGSGNLTNVPKYEGGSPLDRLVAWSASFGVFGVLLLAGAFQAWRRMRWFFCFSLLAILFSGPIFVAYANMNLSVPLSRFVLERFYLLSHVAAAPLAAFGVLLATDLLGSAVPALRAYASALVTFGLLLALVGVGIANYAEIDQSRNHLVRQFAEDIFATLERGAILAVDGDEVIMPLTYLQDVEGYRPDVVLLVMPLMNTDWYLPQVQRQHPELVVPFSRYDGISGTMKALIEANPGRMVAADGVISEDSLNQGYWFHRRGLVDVIEPISKDVTLNEMIAETETLFSLYHPPSPRAIKWKSLEPTILSHYATPAVVVAQQCRQLHNDSQARIWYERALALDPTLSDVRDALAELRRQP